jgi:alpha-amylase
MPVMTTSEANNRIDQKPTPENNTLLQGYEWNCPSDSKHYKRLAAEVPKLKAIGINNIWLPPGCKAANPEGVGFDIYDLYDLGEFDQKGNRATKWGSKEDLMELSRIAKEHGVGLYWDAVLNHKAGADKTEKCRVVEVDSNDRTKEVGEPYEIEGWLGFDFPGRGDKYSSMKYHWHHFSGTDYNQANEKKAIYKIVGDNKGWSNSVDDEGGNADYMMFADIDYRHPEVQEDVKCMDHKRAGTQGFPTRCCTALQRALHKRLDRECARAVRKGHLHGRVSPAKLRMVNKVNILVVSSGLATVL